MNGLHSKTTCNLLLSDESPLHTLQPMYKSVTFEMPSVRPMPIPTTTVAFATHDHPAPSSFETRVLNAALKPFGMV
jgi:hypothetical protein